MKDIYGALRFDNVFDLKNFLNLNEIEPKDIVDITKEQERYTLIYLKNRDE